MKVKLSNPPTGAVKVRLLSSWFTFCLFSFFLFVDSSDDMLIGMMKQWDSLDEETKLAFTLSGNASVEELFVDDSNKGSGTHYKYSESDIEEFVNQAAKMIETVRKLPEEVRWMYERWCAQHLVEFRSISCVEREREFDRNFLWRDSRWLSSFRMTLKRHGLPRYEILSGASSSACWIREGRGGCNWVQLQDIYIVQALLDEKERLHNASVIVFGSNSPNIESMILQLDASSSITTVMWGVCWLLLLIFFLVIFAFKFLCARGFEWRWDLKTVAGGL